MISGYGHVGDGERVAISIHIVARQINRNRRVFGGFSNVINCNRRVVDVVHCHRGFGHIGAAIAVFDGVADRCFAKEIVGRCKDQFVVDDFNSALIGRNRRCGDRQIVAIRIRVIGKYVNCDRGFFVSCDGVIYRIRRVIDRADGNRDRTFGLVPIGVRGHIGDRVGAVEIRVGRVFNCPVRVDRDRAVFGNRRARDGQRVTVRVAVIGQRVDCDRRVFFGACRVRCGDRRVVFGRHSDRDRAGGFRTTWIGHDIGDRVRTIEIRVRCVFDCAIGVNRDCAVFRNRCSGNRQRIAIDVDVIGERIDGNGRIFCGAGCVRVGHRSNVLFVRDDVFDFKELKRFAGWVAVRVHKHHGSVKAVTVAVDRDVFQNESSATGQVQRIVVVAASATVNRVAYAANNRVGIVARVDDVCSGTAVDEVFACAARDRVVKHTFQADVIQQDAEIVVFFGQFTEFQTVQTAGAFDFEGKGLPGAIFSECGRRHTNQFTVPIDFDAVFTVRLTLSRVEIQLVRDTSFGRNILKDIVDLTLNIQFNEVVAINGINTFEAIAPAFEPVAVRLPSRQRRGLAKGIVRLPAFKAAVDENISIAKQCVVAIATVDDVCAGATIDKVVIGSTVQLVVTRSAINGVIAFSGNDDIIARARNDNVVLRRFAGQDRVVVVDPVAFGVAQIVDIDHIVAVGAFNNAIQSRCEGQIVDCARTAKDDIHARHTVDVKFDVALTVVRHAVNVDGFDQLARCVIESDPRAFFDVEKGQAVDG